MNKDTFTVEIDSNKYLVFDLFTNNCQLVNDFSKDKINSNIENNINVLNISHFKSDLKCKSESNSIDSIIEDEEFNTYRYGIITTYKCNFRCKYCFNWLGFENNNPEDDKVISREYVDKCFASIEKLELQKPTHKFRSPIFLYGGEPLLPETKPIVEYILKKARSKGYTVAANTNGYSLLDFIEVFKNSNNMSSVGITIDGLQQDHDNRRLTIKGGATFSKIISGIEAARKISLRIGIRINIDKRNIETIPDLSTFFIEKGWLNDPLMSFTICRVAKTGNTEEDKFSLSPDFGAKRIIDMYSSGKLHHRIKYDWGYNAIKPLLYQKENTQKARTFMPKTQYCPGNSHGYIFDPLGDIYGCPRGVGNPKFKIGEYSNTLEMNDTYEILKKRTINNIQECKNCKFATLCGGGCFYDAFISKGSFLSNYCEQIKPFIKHALPYYVRILNDNKKPTISHNKK